MRTVNEMTWEQRCAADAKTRDWAMEYGRSAFYYSEKWGQLTAVADGTTTLTDIADALVAGRATPYQEALAASYWVDAADHLAAHALGEVAKARHGHPHDGLADGWGQVLWLVDLAAAQQRQADANAALAQAQQIRHAAVERDQDQGWEPLGPWTDAQRDQVREDYLAGLAAAEQAAADMSAAAGIDNPQLWERMAASTAAHHGYSLDAAGFEAKRDQRAWEDSMDAEARQRDYSDDNGQFPPCTVAERDCGELAEANLAEAQRVGRGLDEYSAQDAYTDAVAEHKAAAYDAAHEGLFGEAAAAERYRAVRATYDELYDPAYYASIEGDGGKEDQYCDTVWEHAEQLIDTGRGANYAAQSALQARAQVASEGWVAEDAYEDGQEMTAAAAASFLDDPAADALSELGDLPAPFELTPAADEALDATGPAPVRWESVAAKLLDDLDQACAQLAAGHVLEVDRAAHEARIEGLEAETAQAGAEEDEAELRAQAQAELWGPAGMTAAEWLVAGSRDDAARGMTAAQLRGEAVDISAENLGAGWAPDEDVAATHDADLDDGGQAHLLGEDGKEPPSESSGDGETGAGGQPRGKAGEPSTEELVAAARGAAAELAAEQDLAEAPVTDAAVVEDSAVTDDATPVPEMR